MVVAMNSQTRLVDTDEDGEDVIDRDYVCTSCDGVVRAHWFGDGSFSIGCDCDTVPVVPQMGQWETPDKWEPQRPECCRDTDVKELYRVYGDRGVDRKCTECGTLYDIQGTMQGVEEE